MTWQQPQPHPLHKMMGCTTTPTVDDTALYNSYHIMVQNPIYSTLAEGGVPSEYSMITEGELLAGYRAKGDNGVPSEYSVITEGERLAGYRAKGDNGVPSEYSIITETQFTSN